jgi:hypothetical protein
MTYETATARPWHGQIGAFIATWWQQIAITQAGIYLVASFGQSHAILPPAAAWALAIGMEGTYLKGLIDAGHVRGKGGAYATMLIVGTYATVICWGIAYILGLPSVGVIPAGDLGQAWGALIAVIHVLPIAFTGGCSAMLHRARTGEEAARRATQEAEAHDRQLRLAAQLDLEAEEDRAQRRQIALDQERVASEIEAVKRKAIANLEYRQARNAFADSVRGEQSANTPQATQIASGTDLNSVREQIARTLTEQPGIKKTQLAKDLGISRTKLYEHITALKLEGRI